MGLPRPEGRPLLGGKDRSGLGGIASGKKDHTDVEMAEQGSNLPRWLVPS